MNRSVREAILIKTPKMGHVTAVVLIRNEPRNWEIIALDDRLHIFYIEAEGLAQHK